MSKKKNEKKSENKSEKKVEKKIEKKRKKKSKERNFDRWLIISYVLVAIFFVIGLLLIADGDLSFGPIVLASAMIMLLNILREVRKEKQK